MKILLRYCCSWLCSLCIVGQLAGQEIAKISVGTEDGLSQGFIPSIVQDRDDFIWLGTKNGLNRYDGRSFKVFHAEPGEKEALNHEYITHLASKGDYLVISTFGGGVQLLHRPSERFFTIFDQELLIPRMEVDANGNIWVFSNTLGSVMKLYRLRPKEDFWEASLAEGISQEDFSVELLDPTCPRGAKIDSGTETYYSANNGVLTIKSFHSGEERKIQHPEVKQNFGLYLSKTYGMLYLNGGEILRLNGTEWETFSQLTTEKQLFHLILGEDDVGNLLISNELTSTIGVSLNKVNNSVVVNWIVDNEHPTWTGLVKNDLIVVGTAGYGFTVINPKGQQFQNYCLGSSVYAPPLIESTGIRCLAFPLPQKEDKYLAKKPSLEKGVNFFKNVTTANKIKTRYSINSVGDYWMFWYNAERRKFYLSLTASDLREKKRVGLPLPLTDKLYGQVTIGGDDCPWVAVNGQLLQYDIVAEKLIAYSYRNIMTNDHEVRALVPRSGGGWWLGTSLGLIEAIPKGEGFDFKWWKRGDLVPGLSGVHDISCLYQAPDALETLWIATKGEGLFKWHTTTGEIDNWSQKNGFPDNTVYGILPDDYDRLWLSTNKGLIRFHPTTQAIRRYTSQDGLQGDEFNTWAYLRSPDGRLMFGGVNGLTTFTPKPPTDNQQFRKVWMTGLEVNGEVIQAGDTTRILEQSFEFTEAIELSHQQNSLGFDFTTLEFNRPFDTRFRYYLEGAEAEWAHEGKDNQAKYLNLSPGKYSFHVMASNSDGDWNPTPTSLRIRIYPPWYLSPLAYLLYGLALAGMLLGGGWLRLRQLRLRQQVLFEQREAKRAREVADFKTKVYTNLTHEFRTPLTLILGASEELSKEKTVSSSPWVSSVHRNGKRLLHLVDQLLDSMRVEYAGPAVSWEHGNVVPFARKIVEGLLPLAEARGQQLTVSTEMEEFLMDFDPEKLRLILTNLLSNAIKYTPEGGEVLLRLAAASNAGQAFVLLQIQDTGIGISQGDLDRIFDRFYRAKGEEKVRGTGIGLGLCRETVQLLGGTISVESELGVGSTFTVRLPVKREVVTTEVSKAALPLPNATSSTFIATTGSSERRPRLLIVEDNKEIAAYLSHCVKDDFEIQNAYDGEEGLKHALTYLPDIILSDVMMPRKDGLSLCSELKNNLLTSHIPIVLLTALADVESRLSGLRRGADAYLGKPFHQEELLVVLHELLAGRERLRKHYQGVSLGKEGLTKPAEAVAADLSPEEDFLHSLRKELLENLDNSGLNAESIGRKLGISRAALYAKLSSLTGMSFGYYLSTLRLQQAESLLTGKERTIAEIAYTVGFNDPKYFSRVFKKHYGISPREFRGDRV